MPKNPNNAQTKAPAAQQGTNEDQEAARAAEKARRHEIEAKHPTNVEVQYFNLKNEGKTLGTCNLMLNGALVIRNVRLVDGENGPFPSMPAYKSGNDFKEHVFPLKDSELLKQITSAMKDAYDQKMQQTIGEYQQRQQAAAGREAPDPFASPEPQMAAGSGQEMQGM